MVLAALSGMTKLGERETYAGAAAAVLLAGVLHELYRIFVVPWPHITPLLSVAMSTLLVVVWAAAIVTVLRERREGEMSSFALFVSIAAVFSLVTQGIVVRVAANSFLGLFYLAAAIAVGFCFRRTWRGRAVRALR